MPHNVVIDLSHFAAAACCLTAWTFWNVLVSEIWLHL
jgi:hypothetical protein